MTRVLRVAKTAARGAWRHALETDDHDVLLSIGQNPAYTLSKPICTPILDQSMAFRPELIFLPCLK